MVCVVASVHGLPPSLMAPGDANSIKAMLTERYLLDTNPLSIHQVTETQRFWRRTMNPSTLLACEFPTAPDANIVLGSNLATGAGTSVSEVALDSGNRLASATNSTSLSRRVDGNSSNFVKGSSTNYPFRPGG